MKRKICFYLLALVFSLCFCSEAVLAADIQSLASGNWNNTATWNTATVPTSGDNVTIKAGHIVTVNAAASCAALTIEAPTGKLQFQATGANLTLNGAMTVAGTFEAKPTSGTMTITTYGITITGTFTLETNGGATINLNNSTTAITNTGTFTLKTNAATDAINITSSVPSPGPDINNSGSCTITGFDNDHKNITITTTNYFSSSGSTTSIYAKFDGGTSGLTLTGIDGFLKTVSLTFSEFYNSGYGLEVSGCDRLTSWYGNKISTCTFYNNSNGGIHLSSTNRTELLYNTCYNNTGTANTGYGIILETSSRNHLYSNICYNNKLFGIYLNNSSYNLLDNNICHDQVTENGIYLYNNSNYNCLFSNQSYKNYVHGISIESSSYNYLYGNTCYNNNTSGIRLRYSSNSNLLMANKSYANTNISVENPPKKGTALSSYDCTSNLCIDEIYGNDGVTKQANAIGDIFIEGEANEGKISQLWLKNCLLNSDSELTDTSDKQEFSKANSWIISEKHDNTVGLVKIYGQFSLPQYSLPQGTVDSLNWSYADALYNSFVSTPFLRYDDSSNLGITAVTIFATTKSECWRVIYDASVNKWTAIGTASGTQSNLVSPDTDYTSDGDEVRFRITQHTTPVTGVEYVFFTCSPSGDTNTQKQVKFCDFTDAAYIGASFENNGTVNIAGTTSNNTLITHENVSATDFYYNFKLGGTVTALKYAQFDYLNASGLQINAVPSAENIQYVKLQNIKSGGTHLTSSITHSLDNMYFDNTGTYNCAGTGILTFRDYSRTNLSDNMSASGSVTWDPTLTWTGSGNFATDGVDPNDALTNSNFEFRVKYTDQGVATTGDTPSVIQVWVDVNDNGTYETGEKFNMTKVTEVGVNDNNYTNGEIYTYTYQGMQYAGDGQIFYRFYATNPYSTTTVSSVDTHEATGVATVGNTYFSISGTTPRAQVTTPSGDQTGEISLTYTLLDNEANTCSITCEYCLVSDTNTWFTATKGTGGDNITGLNSSSSGVTHTFVWNTRTDLPNQQKTVKFRITPADISGTGTVGISESFTVVNTASASKSTVTVSPSTVAADGTSQATIIVTLLDPLSNPVQSKTVTLAVTGSDNTITQPTALSDSNGQTIGYLASTKAETKIITATVTSDSITLQQQPTVTFSHLAVDPNTSTVTADPDEATANGINTITLVITLKDRYNNLVSGKQVSLSATGTENIITQPASLTDTNGRTTGTIASTKIETKTVTATDTTDSIKINNTKDVFFLPESGIEVGSDSLVFGDTQKGELKIYYANPKSETTAFKVFNLNGMLIYEETISGSESVATWNGKDKDGQSVETGIYIYQLEIGSTVKNGSIVAIK